MAKVEHNACLRENGGRGSRVRRGGAGDGSTRKTTQIPEEEEHDEEGTGVARRASTVVADARRRPGRRGGDPLLVLAYMLVYVEIAWLILLVVRAARLVIDGWGIPSADSPKDGDAIAAATTPVMDAFAKAVGGYTELEASSLAVGLPEGLMGNSEVGHLNIGAGRVVWQDVVRIDQSVRKDEFAQNPVVHETLTAAKNGTGRLHLCGLVSHGGVHSKQEHLYALLRAAKAVGVPHVYVHFFGDGRDTDPKSGAAYLKELLATMQEIGTGEIATLVGRYYAMDRDKRWDRTELALKGMVLGEGEASEDPLKTVEERYQKGENDEFLKPIVVGGQERRIQDNDNVFFFNYRSDRARQIVQLLGDVDRSPKPDFPYPKNITLVTMTQYKLGYPFRIAFQPQHMGNVLAEWLGKQGVPQVHVAETEKYAHVTFFFNGGVEKAFPLETRDESQDLVPSNKSVATYDLAPEMSAAGVAAQVAKRVNEDDDQDDHHHKFPFVMCNLAPPDMVGHTGVYDAAVVGCTATDKAIGTIYEACKQAGYVLFVTADHGNAEEMKFPDGKPKTSHTTNKVPLIMANAPRGWRLRRDVPGVLGDVAPTVLAAMGLPQPEEMTGQSLLEKE
ncbi:phosphoglycerate mutase, 2,3-bisphosphoglycerate-independent [Niveomyces insectorum RCEF 264]|uniref:2,3-bisphosphoglycerate-independent phosphoglycerate mutase n=1 Tax=Niveomyces insectorum RCEF 264 TaxID=1081102 RepID=A0A167S3U5_9HYPO|nr:phosphoglycerate mutase, 2,3-bisphosphoglycerate-independent [Niveomyces insectorum RCEF 264]